VKDALTVTRPDQLQALGDTTRMRILGWLSDTPASIQELARGLNVPKGTVGHHIHVLEAAGLIRVAETEQVRGVQQKRYARVARVFQLPTEGRAELAKSGVDDDLLNLPLRQALDEARPATTKDDPSASVLMRARMPAERALRFARLLESLAAEFSAGAPGTGEMFAMVAAVYVPDWSAAAGAPTADVSARPARRTRPVDR
jgi:DNA-binding transcriptional ArsR family regulator